MSAPTNLVTSATPNVGAREDLEDVIYRVAAEETPLSKNIGTANCTAVLHEWQVESLANPNAANAKLEGDDVSTLDSANLTTRVSNYLQIYEKTGGVSRTQKRVKLAGRQDEMDRQIMLKGLEIKRDLEARAIGNYASNAESGATARKHGGALAWATSNVSRGAGGSSGGFSAGAVSAATNGTQRTFTEALLKSVLATGFGNGARFKQAYMGATQKQEASAFTGIANIRRDAGDTSKSTMIVGAADIYGSDFGNIVFIPHPYGLTRDVLLCDPEYLAIGTLDPIKTDDLSKTGDSDRFIMTMEKTLIVRNEKALGVISDLQ